MQNLLAKLAALGVIGGGFAATGDLGWIAQRGMRVLETVDVASAATAEEPAAAANGGALDASPPCGSPSGPPAPVSSPIAASPARAAPPGPVAPAAAPAIAMKPPAGGPRQIVWTKLAAGGRVVVWLTSGGTRCLVLDVVDPATGEALAYEAAAVSPEGRPLTTAGPPRRVVVGRGGDENELAVGGMLQLAPAGIATAGNSGRWLGPIDALTLVE
jgi:hypothetical protein